MISASSASLSLISCSPSPVRDHRQAVRQAVGLGGLAFFERLGSRFSDDEFDTIGGMVTSEFGHLPDAGEEVELGGFHFHVTRTDDRRVLQFSVRALDA